MSDKKAEELAYDYFKSGYWCSESVFKAITEIYSENVDGSLSRMTSGFVGGIGSSHKEACGALTGGIIALGYLYGRTEPGEKLEILLEMIVKFRERFNREFGNTKCGVLLEGFGEQGEDDAKCRDLTARTACTLAELIEEYKDL